MNSYHGPFRSSRESQWMRALHLNLSQDCNLVLLPVFTTAHHGPFILLINPQWMRALHPNLSQDCNLVPLPVFMLLPGSDLQPSILQFVGFALLFLGFIMCCYFTYQAQYGTRKFHYASLMINGCAALAYLYMASKSGYLIRADDGYAVAI